MISSSANSKYCVIGAGPCGLAATKQLASRGIPVQCFEREDDVGGNWYFGKSSSSVYASAHLISSKRMTEFTDYPMPKEFPPFPHHSQALQYLRDYANNFELKRHIRFGSEIIAADRDNDQWQIKWRDVESGRTQTDTFAGLIVANGHHWSPHRPEFEGDFTGQTIHASEYKTPEILAGKRVLVVGAGNSGCDIAVDDNVSQHATWLSLLAEIFVR
jgi:cation diffusion facilitator CzcD-associated flavoprotein CzcO